MNKFTNKIINNSLLLAYYLYLSAFLPDPSIAKGMEHTYLSNLS